MNGVFCSEEFLVLPRSGLCGRLAGLTVEQSVEFCYAVMPGQKKFIRLNHVHFRQKSGSFALESGFSMKRGYSMVPMFPDFLQSSEEWVECIRAPESRHCFKVE